MTVAPPSQSVFDVVPDIVPSLLSSWIVIAVAGGATRFWRGAGAVHRARASSPGVVVRIYRQPVADVCRFRPAVAVRSPVATVSLRRRSAARSLAALKF